MFQNLILKAYAATGGFDSPGAGLPAPTTSAIGDYRTLLQSILTNIVNPIIALMVGVAVLYFLWGAFTFIQNADNAEERKKGGMNMLWGALGLFLMATAYGVLALISNTVRQ